MAIEDGEDPDELCWRFQQEYPSTIDEAFRAGRKGGYIKGSMVAAARSRRNPHQADMPLVFGCDFATGGGGENSEYTSAEQLSGSACGRAFAGYRGRRQQRIHVHARTSDRAGRLYERFKDQELRLGCRQAPAPYRGTSAGSRLHGSGAAVAPKSTTRFARVATAAPLSLSTLAGKSADPACRNKRSEMHKNFREWLKDGDIPDDPLLESEITATWVIREEDDERSVACPEAGSPAKAEGDPRTARMLAYSARRARCGAGAVDPSSLAGQEGKERRMSDLSDHQVVGVIEGKLHR